MNQQDSGGNSGSVPEIKSHDTVPSGRLSSYVLESSPVTGPAFTVHLVLGVLVDDAGYVEASVEDLAKLARVSEKTARRALKELQDLSLISREIRGGGGRGASVYRLSPAVSVTAGGLGAPKKEPKKEPPAVSVTSGDPPAVSVTGGDDPYIDIYGDPGSRGGGVGEGAQPKTPAVSVTSGDPPAVSVTSGPSKTELVIDYFCQVTGRQAPPSYKKLAWRDRWILPANELLGFCQDQVEPTKALIDQTLAYMSQKGLTVASPGSLVNVAGAKPWGQNGTPAPSGWTERGSVWTRDVSGEWQAYAASHDVEAEGRAELAKWGISEVPELEDLPPWI